MEMSRDGLRALQEALRALEDRAKSACRAKGRSYSRREVAKAVTRRYHASLHSSRITEWLREEGGRAPRDEDQVWALVRVWNDLAGLPVQDGDRLHWNRLVRDAQPPRPTRFDGIGRPLSEWVDPLDLEIHPAISALNGPLPALTRYVRRAHDDTLAEVVERAQWISTMAVLVGGSATGKTRACWEALQGLPDDWRLWHPIVPGRPQAILENLAQVGPRTVVWLNEIQHYLLTPGRDLGEQVAAGLRDLHRDSQRGPVLVLGTMWPKHWATLTGYSPLNEDPHAQARALLTGKEIVVPTAFTGPDLDQARAAADTDPRLAEALKHAEDGHLTQYLAGGPALLERYRTASPAAKALMDAAIDARRVGHGPLLPHSLLTNAAYGYLRRPEPSGQ